MSQYLNPARVDFWNDYAPWYRRWRTHNENLEPILQAGKNIPARLLLILLVLHGFGLPALGDAPQPKNFNVYLPAVTRTGPNDVILNPQAIGGAGCSILYQGKTFNGPVVVPKSALVGAVINDKGYLYHPSLGGNIGFSDATNRLAFKRFWLQSPDDFQDPGPDPAGEAYSQLVFDSAYDGVPNGGESTLSTLVTIKRTDPYVTITNTIGRWVAIKIYYKESPFKIYFLAPAGRYLSSNMVSTLGNLKVISHPLLDDASSPSSIRIPSAQITKIETFGAVYRGVSIFASQKKWPPGSEESWNGPDQGLVLKINLIDTVHMWLEGMEHVASLLPAPCVDLLIGGFINMIETTFLTWATDEERILKPYALAMTYDALWSGLKCQGFFMSGGALEVVYTLWDMIVAGGFLVTDHVLLPAYVLTASAYSSKDFYYPPCETTVAPRLDVFVQAKVKGPVGADVSYNYIKKYCNGIWSNVIGPYTGKIGTNGIYLASMLGSFKLENSQDEILVRATVNGQQKQVILSYNSFGWDGFSILFPKVAELVFP